MSELTSFDRLLDIWGSKGDEVFKELMNYRVENCHYINLPRVCMTHQRFVEIGSKKFNFYIRILPTMWDNVYEGHYPIKDLPDMIEDDWFEMNINNTDLEVIEERWSPGIIYSVFEPDLDKDKIKAFKRLFYDTPDFDMDACEVFLIKRLLHGVVDDDAWIKTLPVYDFSRANEPVFISNFVKETYDRVDDLFRMINSRLDIFINNLMDVYQGIGQMLHEYEFVHTKHKEIKYGSKRCLLKSTTLGIEMLFPDGLNINDLKEDKEMPEFGGSGKQKVEGIKKKEPTIKPATEKVEPLEVTTEDLIGDKNCYVFFDMEFTGLRGWPDPISIGCVDMHGRTFYAEFTDYDSGKFENPEWMEENVIKNLMHPELSTGGDHWTMSGTRREVSLQLNAWLDSVSRLNNGSIIQMVSDVCHYDFVLFMDIISNGRGAFAVEPDRISPCCYDINHCFADMIYRKKGVDNKNFVPLRAAFDIDRKEIAESLDGFTYEGTGVTGDKHNALVDALHIRAVFRYIHGID